MSSVCCKQRLQTEDRSGKQQKQKHNKDIFAGRIKHRNSAKNSLSLQNTLLYTYLCIYRSYAFLELIQDQNEYRLADEIINVQHVFKRSVGSRTGQGNGSGSSFEPFSAAFINSYLLSGSQIGGIGTYYLYSAYQEQVQKMFGGAVEFFFKPQTHILTILQRPLAQGEQIMLQTHNYRPDFAILTDIYAKQWIRDYTLATCKIILGEARSTFQSIAGPTGSISMNGDALKAAGKEEIEKLDKELDTQMAGGVGMTWVIG